MAAPLHITGTEDTPEIHYDPKGCGLSVRGSSFPEDTYDFYQPIFTWVKEHLKDESAGTLNVNLELNYYNSSSSKVFMNLFHLLEEYVAAGKKIAVNWFYDPDDEDSLEEGKDFGVGLEVLPFNLKPRA